MTEPESNDVTDARLFIGLTVALLCIILLVVAYFTKRRRLGNQKDQTVDRVIPRPLQSNARRLGLIVHQVDGDCMYASLADQLQHCSPTGSYTTDIVRTRAEVEIKRNLTSYRDITQEKWDGDFESLMLSNGQNKRTLLLYSVANAFSRTVEVIHHDRMDSTVIRPFHVLAGQSTKVLYVGHAGDERFVSLRQEKPPTLENQRPDRRSGMDRRSNGEHSAQNARQNILVGDGSNQFIVHPTFGENNVDDVCVTRNIVVGEGSTQNVLATFRTSNEVIECLKTMQQVGDDGSQPLLRLKIRQKSQDVSETDIEETEKRLIELLQDEDSEARHEVDEILENFGVSFVTATFECILLQIAPDSYQAIHAFVKQFQRGELISLIRTLVSKQYEARKCTIDVHVQLQMQLNPSEIVHTNSVHRTESKKSTDGGSQKARTQSKKMSPGISLLLSMTNSTEKKAPANELPEQIARNVLEQLQKTGKLRRNAEIDVRLEKFCSTETPTSETSTPKKLQDASNIMSTFMEGCIGVVRTNDGRFGTGFRVGDKHIMTACHVVKEMMEDKKDVSVEFPDTEEICNARIVYANETLDVAILELPTTSTPSRTLTEVTDLHPGSCIHIVGYRCYNHRYLVTEVEREIEKTNVIDEAMLPHMGIDNMILFGSEAFGPGSSGSPGVAVVDGRANIVAMLLGSAGTVGDQKLCYGVKLIDLIKKLETDRPDIYCMFMRISWLHNTEQNSTFVRAIEKDRLKRGFGYVGISSPREVTCAYHKYKHFTAMWSQLMMMFESEHC